MAAQIDFTVGPLPDILVSRVEPIVVHLTIIGSSLTILLATLSIASFAVFRQIRQCPCNIVLFYCGIIDWIEAVNLGAAAAYITNTGLMPQEGLGCQFNGGIYESGFMGQSAVGLVYLVMLINFKAGTASSRRWAYVTLVCNTVLYLILPIYISVAEKGFAPRQYKIHCALNRDETPAAYYAILRTAGILVPLVVGFGFMIYMLHRTWHMKDLNPKGFSMVLVRSGYNVIFFVCGMLLLWLLHQDPETVAVTTSEAEEGSRGTAALAFAGAVRMGLFIYAEGLVERWRRKLFGLPQLRKDQLERQYRNKYHIPVDDVLTGPQCAELEAMWLEERKDPILEKPLSEVLDEMGDGADDTTVDTGRSSYSMANSGLAAEEAKRASGLSDGSPPRPGSMLPRPKYITVVEAVRTPTSGRRSAVEQFPASHDRGEEETPPTSCGRGLPKANADDLHLEQGLLREE